MLWSLPKAAPALLRHIAAYIELAGLDFTRAKRELGTEIIAGVLVAVFAAATLMLGCILVIALTWDTPYRVAAIACMAAGSLAVAVGAAVYRARVIGSRSDLLATVHQQWQEDRVLLERILSDED